MAVDANFYFIAPRWSGGPLVPSAYGGEHLTGQTGAEIKETI